MGRRTSVMLDTNSLPPDEAHKLRDLINNSNFFDQPSPPLPTGAADSIIYKITVEGDDERKHTIQTYDIPDIIPPELEPLIAFLDRKAK